MGSLRSYHLTLVVLVSMWASTLVGSLSLPVPVEAVAESNRPAIPRGFKFYLLRQLLPQQPEAVDFLMTRGFFERSDLERLPLQGLSPLGFTLAQVPLEEQERLVAPYLERASAHFRRTGKKTVVIGHLPETHAGIWLRGDTREFIAVLNVPDWTLDRNLLWLKEAILNNDGVEVLIASLPRVGKANDLVDPMFHVELRTLADAGYVRVGNYLRKAPAPLRYAPGEITHFAGVCIVRSCY